LDGKRKVLDPAEVGDPMNLLTQTASIQDLAFTLCLKESELALICPGKPIPANSQHRSQTFFSALFTCLMQWAFCFMIIYEFTDVLEAQKATEENTLVIIAKVIACIIFHFTFTPEIIHAIHMFKFAAYHPEKFESRSNAVFIAFLKGGVVVVLEALLLANLGYFTDHSGGAKQVAFDFAALAVIATFDDVLIVMFNSSDVIKFKDAKLPFVRLMEPRRKQLAMEEEKFF
jgi:hypothetical protein